MWLLEGLVGVEEWTDRTSRKRKLKAYRSFPPIIRFFTNASRREVQQLQSYRR